jgi:hypothetical protein
MSLASLADGFSCFSSVFLRGAIASRICSDEVQLKSDGERQVAKVSSYVGPRQGMRAVQEEGATYPPRAGTPTNASMASAIT